MSFALLLVFGILMLGVMPLHSAEAQPGKDQGKGQPKTKTGLITNDPGACKGYTLIAGRDGILANSATR